ncbi:hypothetical protein SAMN05443529_10847 [Desulfosporosinus hippei DSM 8344]|uniref:Uncharacterized protein n=1 Tax=Desulfosporosinus hippei DSM 8344 TaxID=1121419 RepID=A0A1G7YGP7_9FIRM|nr:hypothetical protein SAMN05443529_10847 [Desulfosporosinus hippei DSM 8344]
MEITTIVKDTPMLTMFGIIFIVVFDPTFVANKNNVHKSVSPWLWLTW